MSLGGDGAGSGSRGQYDDEDRPVPCKAWGSGTRVLAVRLEAFLFFLSLQIQ